ncbi:MAG: SAM-dependent methyltransferase [Oscillospiraceae bacterium]|nr:SAM-dependent methyltransferase [Oscillospiraceae bacterium]
MIQIIGLGPGSSDSITIGTLEILKKSNRIFLRTSMHPCVDFIRSQGVEFQTLDFLYESSKSFEEVYEKIANLIADESFLYSEVCYAVPGNPKVAEKSVEILINICKLKNIDFKVYPAVSFLDNVFYRLNLDPIDGIQILDGANIFESIIDRRKGIIICQVYDEFIASDVKIFLNKYFNDEKQIYFLKSLGIDEDEVIEKIELMNLDKMKDIDHLTSVYVPPSKDEIDFKYDIFDLMKIISFLGGENECDFNKKQTGKDLMKYLIEEVYDLDSAIKNDNIANIIEEMGNVLVNIIFLCQLESFYDMFDFIDVTDSICKKLIYRYPHIDKNHKRFRYC